MYEFKSLWLAVCDFCEKNSFRCPPFSWSNRETMQILQQYPSGVTRAVMLTELEHRWRDAVKRGEHSGKLWSVLMNMQVDSADVLSGILDPKDGFRCVLSSSSDAGDNTTTSIDLIMHRRQYQNFFDFCDSKSFSILKNRPVLVTEARLLKQKPPILLPARFMNYVLDAQKTDDGTRTFLQSVILPRHQRFYDCATVSSHGVGIQGARGEPSVTASLPDNSEVFNDNQVICAEVGGISTPFVHPDSPATRVRIVRLLVSRDARLDAPGHSPSSSSSEKGALKKLYLILFDDRICLSNLWEVGTLLMIYRPFLCHSRDEVLFGVNQRNGGFAAMGIHTGNHGLEHMLVRKAAPMLEGALQDPNTLPLMAQYGDVTVISIINNAAAGGSSLAREIGGSFLRSSLGAVPLDKESLTSLCASTSHGHPTAATNATLSLSARLLHIERIPTSGGGDDHAQRALRKCALWMQPLLHDNDSNLLLRVECPLDAERLLRKHKHVLPGQLVHWEGLRPTRTPTQSSKGVGSGTQSETDEASSEQDIDIPDALASHTSQGATVFHFTLDSPHDGAVPGSSNNSVAPTHYRQAGEIHQQSSAVMHHEAVVTSIVKRTLTLSRLTAILHSRSIFSPPTASDPAQAVNAIKGATLGCVQILAAVSHVQAVDDGGVVVVDVTGTGVSTDIYKPKPGCKRRREEGRNIANTEDESDSDSDDNSAWMLTLSSTVSDVGGTVLALLSLHDSMVLTPALDPRSNLASNVMVKKREGIHFSFLLSKVDDVLSPNRRKKYQLGPDTALFRVNVCTLLDL